jgi:ABC-type sugar transport system substrate-binding protein
LSATVAQKPERMGALAVDLSLKALRNEPVPGFVPVELDLFEASP